MTLLTALRSRSEAADRLADEEAQTDEAERLASLDSAITQVEVVPTEQTREELFARYYDDPRQAEREVIRGDFPQRELARIVMEGPFWLRVLAARNPALPAPLVSLLAHDDEVGVVLQVVHHPNLTTDDLTYLADVPHAGANKGTNRYGEFVPRHAAFRLRNGGRCSDSEAFSD